jgi:PAS domain S-box-containing protein
MQAMRDGLLCATGAEDPQDAVEALQAEVAALRSELARQRRILDSVGNCAIVTLDLRSRITAWNLGAVQLFGATEAEMLGAGYEQLFLPADRADGVPAAELCRAVEHGCWESRRWRGRRDGSRFWAFAVAMPLRDADGSPIGIVVMLRDRTAEREADARREMVLAELGHRMKNTLAVVQSVAAQTLRSTDTMGDFHQAFEGRVLALSRSHDMLSEGGWEGAPLREVLARTMEPHGGAAGRIRLQGPAVRLAPHAVVTVNLVMHELATNAAKYGALSVPQGHVKVRWAILREARHPDRQRHLEIDWREDGGPRVQPPTRRGFGSRLIERGLAQEFAAEVRLDFAPEGVCCRLCLPLDRVVATG